MSRERFPPPIVFEREAAWVFWALLTALVGVAFALIARRYKVVEYIEPDEMAG